MKLSVLQNLRESVLDVLFPQDAQCLLCAAPTFGGQLCASCADALRQLRLQEPLCPRCGRPLQQAFCRHCAPEDRIRTCSAYLHKDSAAALIHQLKFNPVEAAARPLAVGMAEALHRFSLPESTVVTWVPMPARRRRQRGIDHARTLASVLADLMGFEAKPLLKRSREVHTQRGLSGTERRINLQDAFEALEACPENVLLVDDVLTTGATLQTCGAVLLDAGAARVIGATATQAIEPQGVQ